MSLIRNSFIVLIIFLNSLTIYTQVSKEEIIVTGSFIKEIQASNTIFTASIDDINQRGTFRIEDYLSSLPMVNPENSALHSNFSNGIIDLLSSLFGLSFKFNNLGKDGPYTSASSIPILKPNFSKFNI